MESIVAIHQPNFLPWLGYFYKIYKADVFVFLDNVQFSKNSYQNRVKIKTTQGALWLTQPVLHNFGQLTNKTKLNNHDKWIDKHLKTLEMNYKKAKYFEEIYNLLKEVYFKKNWEYMSEINITFIKSICNYLGIEKKFLLATDLNLQGSSTDLLIAIIKKVGGNTYLSGIGGKKYQDEEKFAQSNIKLIYSDFTHPIYPQLWGEFIPWLSIIDLLFNCGKESKKYFI